MGIKDKNKNHTSPTPLTYTLEQQLDEWCSTHQFVWTPLTKTATTTNMQSGDKDE